MSKVENGTAAGGRVSRPEDDYDEYLFAVLGVVFLAFLVFVGCYIHKRTRDKKDWLQVRLNRGGRELQRPGVWTDEAETEAASPEEEGPPEFSLEDEVEKMRASKLSATATTTIPPTSITPAPATAAQDGALAPLHIPEKYRTLVAPPKRKNGAIKPKPAVIGAVSSVMGGDAEWGSDSARAPMHGPGGMGNNLDIAFEMQDMTALRRPKPPPAQPHVEVVVACTVEAADEPGNTEEHVVDTGAVDALALAMADDDDNDDDDDDDGQDLGLGLGLPSVDTDKAGEIDFDLDVFMDDMDEV